MEGIKGIHVLQRKFYTLHLDIYGFLHNIDDVGGKRRYSLNILQWCKNDFWSKNSANGDYSNNGRISKFYQKAKRIWIIQQYLFMIGQTQGSLLRLSMPQ